MKKQSSKHFREMVCIYCSECGTKFVENARFCSGCGKAALQNVTELKTPENAVITQSANKQGFLQQQSFSGKVRAAGVILIVTSSLWGIVTLAQIINIITYGIGTSSLSLAVWNTIMTVTGIIQGIKLQHASKSDFKSTYRNTMIGIVWYLIQGIFWHPFVLFFMFLEITIFVLLLFESKSSE